LRMARRRKRLVRIIVLCLLATFALSIIEVVLEGYEIFHGVTSVYLYRLSLVRKRMLLSNLDVDVLAYFPPAIPSEASNARFFFWSPPGDEDYMQRRCELPPDEVTALTDRVAPIATFKAQGSDDFDEKLNAGKLELMNPRFRNVDNTDFAKLPPTFTIYVIGVGRNKKADEEESHIAWEYGIAVDAKRSEVIYWMNECRG
jgi:hypothetical protein